MHKQLLLVATLCGCSHSAPTPVEPQPHAAPQPVIEASPEPERTRELPDATAASPCPMGAARAQLDLCLADVSPGESFTVVPDPKPAFGYVCVFFGTQQRPRCREGEVDVIRRWKDDNNPECPKALSVYWAPHEGSVPVEAQALPDSHLRLRSFPSDGTQFSFIRLDDYIAEASSCLDAAQPMQTTLIDWSNRLLSERPPPQGSEPATVAE